MPVQFMANPTSAENPGVLFRRGIALALLAASAGCATHRPQSGYLLDNTGRPVRNAQGACVQIGPLTPADRNSDCYQLAQLDLNQHIEPLPLDEFGYLFPPLKPKPHLLAAHIALPALIAPPPPVIPLLTAAPSGILAGPASRAPVSTPHFITKAIHFATPSPFRLNRAGLSRNNRMALTAFVDSLEQYRGVEHIRITGHTDKSGPVRFNQWLSEMRARSAQLWLLSLGVNPRSVSVRGVGSSEPRLHARTAADNRYVDIEAVVRAPAD